jgi:hypothetical protein
MVQLVSTVSESSEIEPLLSLPFLSWYFCTAIPCPVDTEF